MRWTPGQWIFAACDMPDLSIEALDWLLEQRAPGRWAVMPKRPDQDRPEPLFACYDYHMASALEQADRPMALSDHDRAFIPTIPGPLKHAWANQNTTADLGAIRPRNRT